MYGYSGDSAFAELIMKALSDAAKKDVFYDNKTHSDGWGMAIISGNQEMYVRKSEPIFKNDFSFVSSSNDKILMLAHARLASETEQKRGWIDSHPFRIFNEEETFYIEHNGYVDKNRLASKFNINIKNLTDTETFAYLLQNLDGNFVEKVKSLLEILHDGGLAGALNLICAGYDYSGKKKICYYSDFTSSKENYLTLVEYSENGNFSVMSSTVAYYLSLVDINFNIINKNAKKVIKDRLFVYDGE